MSSRTLICAIRDGDRAPEVLATARRLADGGGFVPVHVHVVPAPTGAVYAHRGHVGHLAGGFPLPPEELDDLHGAELDRGARLLAALGIGDRESAAVVAGDPAAELLRLARDHDAAMIVVGARRRGALASAVLGSVSRRLVADGDRPVVVARQDGPSREGPVVCGVAEPPEDALRVARVARALARRLGRRLVLAHALAGEVPRTAAAAPGPPHVVPVRRALHEPTELLRDVAAELPGEPPETHLVAGPVAAALDTLADERDAALLVVGSRGHGALRAALERSVSTALSRAAARPVVVVPPACSGAAFPGW